MRFVHAALRLLRLSGQQMSTPVPAAPAATPPSMTSNFALKSSPEILSPQEMLSLPYMSSLSPNPTSDLAFVVVDTYSFDDHKTYKSLIITPIAAGSDPYVFPLPNGGQAFWLDGRTIALVVQSDDGDKQDVFTIPVTFSENVTVGGPIPVGCIPVATATDFRYADSAGVLVFSAYVYADGDLNAVKDNDQQYGNRGNSALVYDGGFERQFNTWVGPKHKSLFTTRLYKNNDNFILANGEDFINVLQGTNLSSPVEPFGGTDDFGISDSHIIFTAKDPTLPPSAHTKQNIYLVGFDGSDLVELTPRDHGATHAPAFSRQEDKVAWLQLDEDGYESDRSKVVIYDLAKGVRFTITQPWDRSPNALAFSESGDFIYFTAEDTARVKIFVFPIPPTPHESTADPELIPPYGAPVPLTSTHTATNLHVLSNGRLLFLRSSIASTPDIYVLENLQQVEAAIKGNASRSVQGELCQITQLSATSLMGKQLHPGEDFWFQGAHQTIHGWVITPPGFRSTDVKKWPVMMVIHGGPQACWTDSWSLQGNHNVFAGQGYVVVAINPTGSTSFGQNLTNAVKEEYGGKPFVDLQNGWKHVLENYPQIDPERAVAAGTSYGGYAMNWIQGNPEFGFGFKALACHAGEFDTTSSGYTSDELFFFQYEFGGHPWDNKSLELSRKYSPSSSVSKWTTPELIVQGSQDYRVPETEGIAAWHALQQRGVPSRLVIFPDESHGFAAPGNNLKWQYELFRWFDEFVGENASVRHN